MSIDIRDEEKEAKYVVVTIEDIIPEKDFTDMKTNWSEMIHPQIYYLLKKIKELEERITKLENPRVVTNK